MLDKVEVRSGNRAEWNAEIAHHGNRFQKNLGQKNRGTPIEINASRMHQLHKRAEQTEIVMRGIAQRRAVSRWMHVRDVRADGQVNRHGDAAFVRHGEDAEIGVFHFDDAAGKKLPGSFPVANPNAVSKFGDFVEILSCFFGHAELAFAKTGIHIFGSVSREGDFKIVNKRRAVHGDSGDESAFHQIDQNGSEADLDDVPADPPENGFTLFARNVNRAEEVA